MSRLFERSLVQILIQRSTLRVIVSVFTTPCTQRPSIIRHDVDIRQSAPPCTSESHGIRSQLKKKTFLLSQTSVALIREVLGSDLGPDIYSESYFSVFTTLCTQRPSIIRQDVDIRQSAPSCTSESHGTRSQLKKKKHFCYHRER